MNLVMEHLLEKVFEPERVPYFTDGLVPIHIVRRLIEQAEQSTEQRIIKLLDQKHTATEGDKTHNKSGNCTACEVMVLIKGENK